MTGFFRDPQAFEALAEKGLAQLVEHKATNASIRVWVPGCGCGEESYSIAMLLVEQLMAARKVHPVQIFATDLDEQTLSIARRGIYPDHIAADVSRERLQRFFNKNGQTYQANRQLRESLLFAVQNPISDPPFIKMDLICCRKLPIDPRSSAQRRLIELFHYALTEDGILFLGSAKPSGHENTLFVPVSRRWGVYRRIEPKRHGVVDYSTLSDWGKPRKQQLPTKPLSSDPPRLRELIQQQLQDYAPACVLINRKCQILYYYGQTNRYLNSPKGIPTDDLMVRVRKGLSTTILAALTRSVRDAVPVTLGGRMVQRDDTYCRVQVTVRPVKARKADTEMMLVIFEDESRYPASAKQDMQAGVAQTLLAQQLVTELKTVQKTIEIHRSDNEELMFANEEIRTMNVELQSINEELEASKKELQSLNRKLITNNKRLQDNMTELEKANDDLDNLLNGNDIATIFLDTRFRIKRFTPTTTELINLIPTDVGRCISDLSGAQHDEDMLEDARCVLDQLTPREKEIHAENRTYIRRIVPYHTRDNRIDGVVITFINITEQRRISQKMAYQAAHDALTGLVNRREFERLLERIIQTAKVSETENVLCYLDLDQFKVVNDTCGHIAGDEMLRQISGVLQTHIRKRDTLARLGGDEFGILMEHCTLDGGQRFVSGLQKAIGDYRFLWEGKSFGIGASMGMVSINAGSGSKSDILRRADAACYVAKEKGRNRIHISNDKDSEVAKRHGEMQWIARIHSALEEDRFHLYYQPISPTNLANDQEHRYELLLRMQDKDGRIISPGAFLPAAERYAFSSRLDRWVIQAAFAWLKSHPRHLQHLDLCSINLSALSLGNEDFLEFVNSRIKEDQLPPQKICFEITETAAITQLATAIRFIRELKAQGCHFALDDFGSGLCSFAYLKNLPVDYLKIDGSFVKDIVDDRVDLAMVKSINDVGQLLELQTVAEFVETAAILAKLQELEVNYVQGYTVAPPRPLVKLGSLL